MRIRATRMGRNSSSTQARYVHDGKDPTETVEGMLVIYRIPGADGRPRWSPSGTSLDATLRMSNRLALLVGEGKEQQLWFSSVIMGEVVPGNGSLMLRTEGSVYRIEVLAEGGTPRRVRRSTGAFPIYDPTPTPE